MRKSILLTVCLVAIVSVLISAPVDSLTCMRVASNFYRERAGAQYTRGASPVLVKTYKTLPNDARDSVNCLHIYNVGDGYVIVSADDRITPVLGYSTEGNFDAQRMPVQLQEWLSQYAAAIGAAVSSPTFTNEAVASSWRALASENYTPTRPGTIIVPPLISTHWDQYPYYNNYCPYNTSANQRTVTGCVATAMAQLIRFWTFPSQGIGSHSYTHPTYGVQSANFGATTYNYSLMPLQLSSSSSTAEINEVARLMYHCGVSVDMYYDLLANGGSGASTQVAASSFITYFGYSGCQYQSKSDFTELQWKNKLKTELNHGRPVLYSGSGSGGHAFICDGYTADNYFHFNFGWSGAHDGYFLLDNITPGAYNFSYTQGGIFNLSASSPILRASEEEIDFLIESGTISEGRKVNIITHNLSNPVSITTSSPFFVSTDSVHYSTSVSLSTGGGAFYIRYQPATGIHSDSANVAITSGSLTENISLKGFTYTINCLPVNDLNISSSDLSHINIAWTEPQMDTTPQILTWNNAKTSNYSYNNNKVTLLQRFTTADLASHHNQTLTGISFYVTSGFSVLKLVVYKGSDFRGTSFNPGTLIVEETIPVSTLTGNSWNTFTLSHPVTIDAHEELCFGVYMESSYAYPIPVGSPIVAKKGSIIGYSNGSGGQSWSQINSYSVCLRGIIQNTQSVTHYEVSRDGPPLGSTTSTSYNDIVSHTDTYHYTVTAYWDNGCSADASQDFTNIASITANPQVLEFHNNYGLSNMVKSVQIGGNGLTQPIQISVSGNFKVSTNGTSYSTSATLPASGGVLYVKYTPTSSSTTFESGQINLTSNTISAHVSLSGQCHGDCNPPENLVLSSSGSTVALDWNAPTYSPDPPQTLSWCTSFGGYYSYGSNNIRLSMVQRFESSDLVLHHNKKLTSISFAIPTDTTVASCKIVVYKGGSYSGGAFNPGTLIYEQNVSLSALSSWNWITVPLNTPVTIDATQELWFGVDISFSGKSFYLCYNSTSSVPKKGGITNYNNYGWYEESISFALKALVEDVPLTLTRYQIDRNNSTIVPNTSATSYTDNVGSNGNYDYTVWAVWSNGCRAGASGSVSISGGCTTPGSVTTRNQCGGTYTWHGTTYNASGTYTYAFTNSSSCQQVDTLRLNIHSNPSVTISGNSSICSGASTTLTASGASTYSWSTGASGASISVHPTSNTTYTVTGTNSYGCSVTATFTVNVTSPTLATVSTSTVSSITTSTATCGGSVSSDACSPVTARGVCWSTSHNPTIIGSHTTNGTGTGTFTSSLSGLTANTTYYVRAYATTAAGTKYGEEKSFKTSCSAVTITISGNTSICSGASTTLTASGANSYTWNTGASGSSITVNPTSSTPYTVTGTNSLGCTGNATVTVTVTPVSLATVNTANVTNITTTAATCGGSVSSDACSPVTARGVCWSTSHNPTVAGSHTTNGTGTGIFTSNLTGLAVNTTYYVRAYATTAAGTAYGTEKTFTTGCTPAQGIETLTACGSYTWHGHTYTASTNTPTYTIPNGAANGCDSIVTLHLTIKPIPVVTISGNTYINRYESTTLTASGASNYTWSTGVHYSSITVSPLVTTTYTVTGTTGGCVSAPASVTVTVGDCIPFYEVETVTACDSFTWHGVTYTESTNTPTHTFPNGASNGCDSIVNLHLTVFHATGSSLYINHCGSYTWGETTYTTSGVYTQESPGPLGCIQVDTLHLTIIPIPVVTISGDTDILLNEGSVIVASGAESYIWSNGVNYAGFIAFPTTTTTYTVTGYNSWCASDPVSITVHVRDCTPAQSIEAVTACDSYTWHGHTYTASTSTATYTIPGGAASGCDSIVTLHLTIHKPAHNAVTVSECGSYTWTSGNGQTYTQSGTYLHSHTDSHGCTQVDTLHLTIKPIPVVTITGNTSIHLYESTTLTAHGASSYTWSNGSHASAITVTPASATTYSVSGTTDGCASAPASVTVSVGPCLPPQGVETVTACGSYTWHGHTYNSSTNTPTYTIPGGAATGCDSIVTLHLTIRPIPVVTIAGNTSILIDESTTLTASGASSYTWSNGSHASAITVSPTSTTTYTVVGTMGGCASAPVSVTVNVSACRPGQRVETITACNSYTWTSGNGQTYTESTNATYTIPNGAVNGCDSIVTLHLIVRHPANEYSVVTGCGSYTWNGTIYTQSGTYTFNHTDSYGCTLMDTLVLTIKPKPVVTVTGNTSILASQSTTLTAQGATSYLWSNGSQANAITVSPTDTTLYTVVGTTDGCSSEPVRVTVNVSPCTPVQGVETVTACDSYTWHGTTYTESTDTATYTIPGGAANGCDSIVTLHLTVRHPANEYSEVTECGSFTWNGTIYTQSGIYTHSHTDSYGCTQMDTLILTINPIPVVTVTGNSSINLNESTTLTVHGSANMYVWSTGSRSSSITVSPTTTTTYSVVGIANGCTSEPVNFTVNVIVCSPVQSVETVTACDSYTWHGRTFYESTDTATYTVPNGTADGCDSTVTLHLTIHHPTHTAVTISECGSYTWTAGNGQTYTTSGHYLYSHTDALGCTQVDTLHLTIKPVPVVTISGNTSIHLYESTTLTAHGASSYSWSNGSHANAITVTPSATTTYSVTGTTDGCASAPASITVNVGSCIPGQGVETVTACGSYTWHGHTYTASTNTATHTISGGAATGCDSIVTLHLTIKPVPVVTISGNTSIHLYESTTLTAHGASSYSWSTGASTGAITVTPSATTTYSVIGTTDGCASAPASVTVNVGSCIPGQGVETVTACGSYTWHGTTYTASTNTATHTIPGGAATGCDSIVTLHLTINHIVASADSVTACDSYTWTDGDGQTYTESGTYTYSHPDANGCTQVDTLFLTIYPTPPAYIIGTTSIHLYESTTLIALGGATYVWSTGETGFSITVAPTVTTTYTVTSYANGCASNPVSVTVEVGPCIPAQGVEEITACGSYTWHGTTYTASTSTATHTIPGGAATGCDSIVTLHLTIKPVPVVTISGNTSIHLYESTTLTAHGASSYSWSTGASTGAITVTPIATTTYSVTGTTDGCASAPASVTVNVGPCIPGQGVETVTACGSYTWHGTTYTANTSTATHTIPGGAASGCDSIVTLHLTLYHPTHTAATVTECNSYTWHGTTYTTSGEYYYVHDDNHGCTQVDTLHLTILHPQHSSTAVNSCGSYTWNGSTYSISGVYTYSHTDANGCTQVDTLHLTVRPKPVVTISGDTYIHLYESSTLTANGADSYVWSTGEQANPITVSPTSATTYSVTGSSNGCTSEPAHITIVVGPCIPAQGVETFTACESFTWHGTTYTESTNTATFTISGGAATGCDSVVTLHLTIHHAQHISTTVSECGSYTWASGNGQTYTQSGTYLHSHTDANNCTQVDTLHLTIRPIPVVTISGNASIHLYESTILSANGANSYSWSTGASSSAITVSPATTTTYSVTGTTDGCASAPASMTVTVGPCIPAQGVETVTACGSYTWHGTTYTASTSTATHTVPNGAATGCDSIVTLHLTINNPAHTAITVSECDSYTWSAGNGQTYTASGHYLYSHPDANGCTQVDTLHLTIRPIPVVTISGNTSIHLYESTTLTANGASSYSWSTGANTGAITVSPATTTTYSVTGTTDGCTSTPASVTVTVGPCIPAQGVETVTACGNYTWYGTTYYESTDTATHTVPNGAVTGCDSIVTLHLTIYNPVHTAITVDTCDSYVWNGIPYTTSGTHTFSHYGEGGCLQVDTLHLTIHHTQYSEFTVAIPDSCYTWNGTEYCENGDFSQTMTDQFGCDSTVTLHLTLRVGVTQYDEQYDLTIYPNPTSSILYIESDAQISQFHLYNAFGQKIKSRTVNGTNGSLDLSDLATGTYYIRVETDKGVVVKKVIRNK